MKKEIPNTFGMQAYADTLVEFASVEELKRVLTEHRGEPVLCVGQGSNLLLRGDYHGLVLRSAMCRVLSLNEDDDYVYIDCGAGIVLDELIDQVCDMGLYGMENLSYIPGTVGASAVQNVGAYRTEAKDLITEVCAVCIATAEERVFTAEECRFAYRDSIFKGELAGQYVITSVTYKLGKKAPEAVTKRPKETRAEIIATRQAKLPEVSEFGSAGSFFKNPYVAQEPLGLKEGEVSLQQLLEQYPDMPHYEAETPGMAKLSAAWLIDHAGLKGLQIGGARVWEKQPLVIINAGGATADDIVALAEKVQQTVQEKYGVVLTPEVNYIG